MAKSVLELAVGTGQWDAGLKKGKQSLDNFIQANGGLQSALNKDSASMQKFVQMMGTFDSTAKTAKGQMNDYKGTIEQLTMQYNRMSEAQKATIGQDWLNAIDSMKQKYQGVADEVNKINQSLKQTQDISSSLTPASGGGGGLFGGDKLSGMLQVFGGNLMTKGAGMAMGFAAEIKDMVTQGIELARQGEGIRIAFERLGRGDILDGLRQATHGTVTDLELMKAAVKFNDFKLPLEELGTMLAFAQQKAKDTGQSVDYMVDSIVTGLGRKSLMILDNLGLSAAQIKDKMAETGDMTKAVGAIIREEMAKAGDYVETAADRATQANVALQNKMEELGRKFAPVQEASNQLWTSIKIGILDIVGGPLADLLNGLTRAGQLRNELKNIGSDERVNSDIAKLKGSNFKEQVYTAMLNKYSREEQRALDNFKKAQKGGMGSIAIWENRYLAQKAMREDFQSRGREVVNGGNSKNTPTTPTNTITPTGTTTPVPVEIKKFDPSVAASAGVHGVDTMPSVFGMADRDAMRAAMGIATPQFDAKQDISKQWKVGKNGQLAQQGQSLADDGRAVAAEWQSAASAISAVGAAMSQIEDPAAKVMGTIAQAIATIALTFASSLKGTVTPWDWIAAAVSGTATMISTISAIHSATGYANGGIVGRAGGGFVPGNSMSGDNVLGMVDGVTPVGLNSGELVLNKAQQANLASALESNGPQNMRLEAVVTAEQIRFMLNSNGRRTGRGEYVTTNFR